MATSPWCGGVAFGVDGVVLINQARALAGGVTAGDAPGFPVTISESGSYRLTGALDVTGQVAPENATAIEVTAHGVNLDLNGFSLVGPTVCTGSPVSACAPTGTGRGIAAFAVRALVVRNGFVRGFGLNGIDAFNARIEDVQAYGNGGIGIQVTSGDLIVDCTAAGNGQTGFVIWNATVRGARALENGLDGIYVYGGAIEESEALHNGRDGFTAAGHSTLASRNLSRGNLECGFNLFSGGYASNVASGTSTFCEGTAIGLNLCNGSLCPP